MLSPSHLHGSEDSDFSLFEAVTRIYQEINFDLIQVRNILYPFEIEVQFFRFSSKTI